MYAGIPFFAVLGAYAVNMQWLDVAMLLIFGLSGLMMRRFGLPVLPLIIGVILGPRIERQLRQTLQLNEGDWSGGLEHRDHRAETPFQFHSGSHSHPHPGELRGP